jgi:hypothetical protein
MKVIKRKDNVVMYHYYTRNGYKFYKDSIGRRFKSADDIVFTPYN